AFSPNAANKTTARVAFCCPTRNESKNFEAGTLKENHIKNYSITFCPFNHKLARKPAQALGIVENRRNTMTKHGTTCLNFSEAISGEKY
ncbi:hypothetical protein OFL77_27150, partial [Escherichia coli]|uniref:hypothetical protein n=1 Tax=Escherichia coli TaxID=562 RepID=UPI0021E0D750